MKRGMADIAKYVGYLILGLILAGIGFMFAKQLIAMLK